MDHASATIPILVFLLGMSGIITVVIATRDSQRFFSPERGRKNLARILTGIGLLCFIVGSCQWFAYGDRKVADICLRDLWFLVTGLGSMGLAAILTVLAYLHGILATQRSAISFPPTSTAFPDAAASGTTSTTAK